MCDFMYVYAWFYVSAYVACFLFEFFYNQYFILELYLVLWYDAELLDLDASLSETENPSLTSLLDHTLLDFFSFYFWTII
jgi:hypothetical protein